VQDEVMEGGGGGMLTDAMSRVDELSKKCDELQKKAASDKETIKALTSKMRLAEMQAAVHKQRASLPTDEDAVATQRAMEEEVSVTRKAMWDLVKLLVGNTKVT
jgi:hypothetical protein